MEQNQNLTSLKLNILEEEKEEKKSSTQSTSNVSETPSLNLKEINLTNISDLSPPPPSPLTPLSSISQSTSNVSETPSLDLKEIDLTNISDLTPPPSPPLLISNLHDSSALKISLKILKCDNEENEDLKDINLSNVFYNVSPLSPLSCSPLPPLFPELEENKIEHEEDNNVPGKEEDRQFSSFPLLSDKNENIIESRKTNYKSVLVPKKKRYSPYRGRHELTRPAIREENNSLLLLRKKVVAELDGMSYVKDDGGNLCTSLFRDYRQEKYKNGKKEEEIRRIILTFILWGFLKEEDDEPLIQRIEKYLINQLSTTTFKELQNLWNKHCDDNNVRSYHQFYKIIQSDIN